MHKVVDNDFLVGVALICQLFPHHWLFHLLADEIAVVLQVSKDGGEELMLLLQVAHHVAEGFDLGMLLVV